jgi:mRNA-degrading endonuclease toxin of MazEF toxin-antitoxin module
MKKLKNYWELDIRIKKTKINNLSLDSIVKLEHIKSISKMRIWDYIWKIDEDYMKIIEEKIVKMMLH